MNTHHRTISAVAAVAIALLAGFFFISAHRVSDREDRAVQSQTQVLTPPETPSLALAIDDVDAFIDLHVYAALDVEGSHVLPETFGGTTEWSPGWVLHWMDVEHDGHIVRLYHITDQHDPGRRFVTAGDEHGHHVADWHAVK